MQPLDAQRLQLLLVARVLASTQTQTRSRHLGEKSKTVDGKHYCKAPIFPATRLNNFTSYKTGNDMKDALNFRWVALASEANVGAN